MSSDKTSGFNLRLKAKVDAKNLQRIIDEQRSHFWPSGSLSPNASALFDIVLGKIAEVRAPYSQMVESSELGALILIADGKKNGFTN